MAFIENLDYADPTNWWLPNHAALPALLRNAGMKVIARPHSHVLIPEPEHYFGKVIYESLIFPKYGKRDGDALHPGPQTVDPELWAGLCQRAKEYQAAQRERREES